ncbi:MAG TPA: radical SAM protein [Candidatus Desulfovibrio intestinigallinarum]|nr:radical SAM protein [Candidatus Desulfovibrio intestinigallinarum]
MSCKHFTNEDYNASFSKEYLREEYLNYPPLWVTLGIISACNYCCEFCSYHSPDARHISKVFNVRYTMPKEEAFKIIDFLHQGGVPRIHICATGEPLLHPDFFSILDYTIERYGSVSFQSNFSSRLLEKTDALQKIRSRQHQISFITTDVMGNSSIKTNSSTDDLYKTLAILSDMDIPKLSGNFLLTKSNLPDLEKVIRKIHAYNLRLNLHVTPIFPHNMNAFTSLGNSWPHGDLQLNSRLQAMAELARELNVRIAIPSATRHRCDVFWKKFQIWPTRNSLPGRNDNIVPHACNAVVLGDMASLGYVFDAPNLMELWNNTHFRNVRRKILAGSAPDAHCAECPYDICPNA